MDDAARIASLETRLGYRFQDRGPLVQALTHRSHAYESQEGALADYERLELLGDSLLGFLVAEWLYRDDAEASEGDLSQRRQSVVRTETLAAAAQVLGLGAELRVGRGEEATGGRDKPSLLADSFEAVLGAVFVDGGLRPARSFVRRHLRDALRATRGMRHPPFDPKTRLQEAVQARSRNTPTYRILSTSGPAHAPRFHAEVLVGGTAVGEGYGTSRKHAEQEAARNALERFAENGA